MTMSSRVSNRYWICQILGWSGYFAAGAAFTANREHFGAIMVIHVFYVALGIGLTHWFRNEIRKHRSPGQSMIRSWKFLATGAFLISLILAAAVIGASTFIDPTSSGDWTGTAVMALWWGMFLASGVWTGLYVGLSERRNFQAREVKLQLSLREAELRVLESQINPHFLFNCLNSIRALVLVDPPRAQDMLTRLANVLRYSLHHDRQHTVPLAAEVDAVSDYLALESVRFEERLRVQVEIEPNVAGCPVPPMLLHTLVENAIKHGIGQVTESGDLTVRADRRDGVIQLVVENTGRLQPASPATTQLGLANTRERLRLLYGDRASLSLKGDNGRVTATVLIPAAAASI